MGSLQKVKQFTTSCTISSSPTRSPSTSPVVHIRRRRRKTLRMLLNHSDERRKFRLNYPESRVAREEGSQERAAATVACGLRSRRKLKDLLMSSPSPPLGEGTESDDGGEAAGPLMPEIATSDGSISIRRRYTGSLRTASGPFRYRLLRRAWRPVLGPIPE
ncbi:hypothetical protein SAY87_007633 [Trapa incisa]|uniref:Uncharacterized protein n=1 Tax=Trapa incisa TaxID=236973 RepID=A0AAN7QF63_9MYRT|nr:hypothetical protein SAY87_007633 [Trapa incisa]